MTTLSKFGSLMVLTGALQLRRGLLLSSSLTHVRFSSAFFCFVTVLSLFLVAQSLLPLILDSDPLIKPWQIPHPIQSMMAFADIFLG
ncbi:hypothetical protein AHAS_Ahas18G0242600 [Arachis hypogaea]